MVPPSFVSHGPKLRVLKIGDWLKMAKSGPENGPLSGQTAIYGKTEVVQSYLRIWGTYDPIESGPSKPKKIGVS